MLEQCVSLGVITFCVYCLFTQISIIIISIIIIIIIRLLIHVKCGICYLFDCIDGKSIYRLSRRTAAMLQVGHRATEPRSISEPLSHFLPRSLSRSAQPRLTKDKSG